MKYPLSGMAWTATAGDWSKWSSHTLKIVLERLAEMVWFIKFHFLLLSIYFPFSGFQARSLFTFATVRIGVYTAQKCGTEPIRYVTLHFRDRRGPASIGHRNRAEIISLMCKQKTYPVWFSCRHKSSLRKHKLRGSQREYSSKPLKHSIVERILVFKR